MHPAAPHLEPRGTLEAHGELDRQPTLLFIAELAALLVESCDGCGEAVVAQQHIHKATL